MATLEQLERAFIQADDAGNVDDAQAFATEIKKLRGNTQASTDANKSVVAPAIEPTIQEKLAKAKEGLANVDNLDVAPQDTFLRRTIQGAASGPVMGAVQSIADNLGQKELSAEIAKNAREGNFAGSLLQPEAWLSGGKAGQFIGKGANFATRALRSGLVGANYGANSVVANPTDSELGDRLKQGAVAGGAAMLMSPVAELATRGGQALVDAVRNRAGKVNAGKLARDVAGDSIDNIKALNASAPDNMTSAQATLPADRDVWQSLGKIAERRDQGSYYRKLGDTQEANRISVMESVKPDLKTAVDARNVASEPFYKVADKTEIVIDKDMSDVFERMPTGVMAKAAKLAKMEGRAFKIPNADDTQSINGESLHYIKRALSDKANASTMTGIGQDEINATKSVLKDFIDVFEKKVPAYGTGRKLYAEGSKPVNQSKVIDAMINTLKNPKGGERSSAFLNALGNGEDALIKRADQTPRFGGVDDILSSPQKSARDKVVNELLRDAEVGKRADAGAGGLADIIVGDKWKARLPPFVDAKYAAANKVLDVIETKVNKKTMAAIVEGMKNGKNANELLSTLPSGERFKVIQALKGQKALPYGFGAVTSMQQGEQ
jgi:GH24 family phage-related lysozyme (muramidase)